MGPWFQTLLGISPKQPVQRGDVLMVLITNAVLIGFNIALTDMLLVKATSMKTPQTELTANVGCIAPEPESQKQLGLERSEGGERAPLILGQADS